MGNPPRVLPSPPPAAVQAVGDGVVEVQALPTSAGVNEPSLYQHPAAPPYYQWAIGSAARASTSYSHAGAYPAMAVIRIWWRRWQWWKWHTATYTNANSTQT